MNGGLLPIRGVVSAVRSTVLLCIALLPFAPAQADGATQLQFRPGVGVGILGLSAELNLEGERWYAGGQLAFTTAFLTGRLAGGEFGGVRAGVFLTEAPTAPFIGVGAGWLRVDSGLITTSASEGWGASAELGLAFRRDQRWFHPQIVLQAIVPFSQQTVTATAPDEPVLLVLGGRLFL